MTTLESVRAKIVEAVPEIQKELGPSPAGDVYVDERDITLADVLRAIGKNYSITFAVSVAGEFEWRTFTNSETLIQFTGVRWNLALPLDEQEPEVIEFIGKVLGV